MIARLIGAAGGNDAVGAGLLIAAVLLTMFYRGRDGFWWWKKP
jgi:hypothetical protein